MRTTQTDLEQFVGIDSVRRAINRNDVTIWRWCRDGKFPKPIYFGTRRMWRLSEVQEWIAAQIAQPRPAPLRFPVRAALIP